MSRHAKSSVYRLRPNHGVAFFDIEISATELARAKACFVEEQFSAEGRNRTVLLPVASDNMFDDGAAWHPETFQPLGPNDAIWLSGQQGIRPLIGHWLPVPYLRMMTGKMSDRLNGDRGGDPGVDPIADQGPLNWVRVFISPPDGPLEEASTLKAVLAVDTQLSGDSRLDQRRYNAPSLEDVSLGSTFVLVDDAKQLTGLLSEPWLNDWLHAIQLANAERPDMPDAANTRFEQEHIARYLFLLKVLCEACPAPILRFASKSRSQSRDHVAVDTKANELILDLSDDVGLAVLIGQQTDEWAAQTSRSRVLPVRDLGQPTNVHAGPLPIRVEFDSAPFGYPRISRQSGCSNAFNWSSLVRIGEEASRISLRPNAQMGTTGSAGLARHVQDVAPIAGMWRSSSDTGPYGKFGPPTRNNAMQYLAEDGAVIGVSENTQPALRPRFSRSSLLTMFIAELILQAISVMNAPQKVNIGETSTPKRDVLSTLRLSLPVSIAAAERETILERASESIDFVWRAQGWDNDENGYAPLKPAVELGLGGDFGVQLIYLHGQLNDIYGGDLPALIEDLNPVRKPTAGGPQVVQFASIAIGFSTTRVVVADYNVIDGGSIRPRLVGTQIVPQGLDAIETAVIDQYLAPAIGAALTSLKPGLSANAAFDLLGRSQLSGEGQPSRQRDLGLRLEDKILRPAARALLEIYSGTPSGGARGVELLTMARLVASGSGRMEPLADLVDEAAAEMGVDGFGLADVAIPFSRHTFRKAILSSLEALLAAAISSIDVDQTDLVFVTSTYTATHDLRDLILSLVPLSPHRLIVLDEQWNAQQDKLLLSGDIDVPVRVGVLSSVIGKHSLLDYDGLEGIEQALQLESEVA